MGKDKGNNPIRTCVSCGTKRNKKELIRLVIDAQGVIIRDDSGTGKGRGAYVCMSKSCWGNLQRGRRLNRAFRKEGPMVVQAGGHSREGQPPGGKKLTLGE